MRLQNSFVCFAFLLLFAFAIFTINFPLKNPKKNFFPSCCCHLWLTTLNKNFFLPIGSMIDNRIFIHFLHTSRKLFPFSAAAFEVQLFTKLLLFNTLFKFPCASLTAPTILFWGRLVMVERTFFFSSLKENSKACAFFRVTDSNASRRLTQDLRFI